MKTPLPPGVFKSVSKLLLEAEANIPYPFNTPERRAVMGTLMSNVPVHTNPFATDNSRHLYRNPAKWRRTWEELMMLAGEVLDEDK